MKINDLVETKEHLVGRVTKVFKNSDLVIVEFRVRVNNTKKHVQVVCKLHRRSLKFAKQSKEWR
jgi:uncharacterized protein YkvS